jgi:hypothetical protein
MRLNDLVNRAKKVVDQRGGTDALKEDAQELKDIASGKGTAQEKAKRAAEALKEPGAPGGQDRPAEGRTGQNQPAEGRTGERPGERR